MPLEGGESSEYYIFDLAFSDTECLEIEYFKSDPSLDKEDKIRYSVTFEKQAPEEAVQLGAERTIFGYTFQCVTERYGTVDVDAIKIQSVNTDLPESNIDAVKPDQPKMELPNGQDYDPTVPLAPGIPITLVFDDIIQNLGQFRVDSCSVNGAYFVKDGCTNDNWDVLQFGIDGLSKKVTVAAVSSTEQSDEMQIVCTVVFCKSCADELTNCDATPPIGNAKIIKDENTASSSSQQNSAGGGPNQKALEIKPRSSISQTISIEAPENPVVIEMDGVKLIVDEAQIKGTEIVGTPLIENPSPESPGKYSSAQGPQLLFLPIFLFLRIFFKI
ncbi:Oidioi.mRNA.OKI2018_I69.chr2.g5305.t1.cds [Oikopleura dioica]|uniref:Oidioi.mRNA.OKI2018_I69.chr2.g5305.t1.cds n=1 Tax=Oikopleura dioica TaxID=34765 RepID=A0ABN7T3M6_OIKDI|nr:Oidioi.mRNA.OKI2018_I69.chr2.g5305.t1.cds [Oikopleura dioica]